MDYKNILEGTRPFFQGLPLPHPSPSAPPTQLNSTGGTTPTPTAHQSPMSLPQNSPQSNPYRMKFEEGLGATLSQMYNTVSPTLRIPASSSSPKNGASPSGGPSPGSRDHHLNLRGGSTANTPIPPASPASSVLNIPSANTLSSPGAQRTNSGSGGTNSGGSGPGVGVRRESPLDLSVKTVRQSADSSTNNNLPEASVGPAPPPSGSGNCVVNSTAGGGTRSLSSSGASTPNNNNAVGPGNNNISSVIAAVANSTTGRDKEKDSGRLLPPPPSRNTQNTTLHQSTESVPAQSQMGSTPGYSSSQSHHLFGVGHHSPYHTPSAVLNIPGGHDPSKIYSHHYLHPQQSPYRLSTPQQQQPTGSHNFQSPISSSSTASGSGSNQNQSGSSTNSVSTTNTATTTTNSQSQPPQSRSSVIPPYNPPQPTFGLGAYHHHSQQQTPTHHPSYHSPNPYASYHIQQPGPGPGQSPHPYYSGHYGSASPAHPSQASHAPTSSSSANNQNTPSSVSRSSVSNHQSNSQKTHEGQPTQQSSQSSTPVYQNHTTSGNTPKPTSQPQLYGHPNVTPNASPAHYPSYSHYYQSHLGSESPRSTPANQSTPKQPIPATPQSRQASNQYPLSYPYAHAQSPAHYSSGYQGSPSHYSNHYTTPSSPLAGGRSPHPNQIQSPHYYSYLHPAATPRPIPPPQTLSTNTQSQLPSASPYPYSSHLNGPRPSAPQPQAPPTAAVPPSNYTSSMSAPLNVPTPKSAPTLAPPVKSPAKGRAGGPKTGEKRKNLLNLLRNSLETRIHEKQEKEKVNHRQTWNFHGKKYHNPLPPPPTGGSMSTSANSSGGAGGSILTGLSHQSNSSDSQGNALGNGSVGNYPGLFGINQRTNFVERQAAQGALSPNTENSLNRIRTKAEKKQVFPNLLSQIEQENANKQQQQQQQLSSSSPFGSQNQQLMLQPQPSVLEKYKKYNAPSSSTSKTSVFDFQDEDEEARVNLSLSRRSPGHSTSPVASISSVIPPPPTPKKRSGSKKFTSKLNKWIPPVGVPVGDKGSTGTKGISPTSLNKGEISVVPVPTTSSYGISSSTTESTEPKRIPTIDNMDEFWATCDSFLDDLSANPTTIKSRRGGLWAKLKSDSTSKEKKSKGRRRRRASAEVDADFQIEEEEEDGPEGEKDVENSESDSEAESEKSKSSYSSVVSKGEEAKGQSKEEEVVTEKKAEENDNDDEEGKKDEVETDKPSQGKRKSSGKLEMSSPKKKKKKRDSSTEEVKGRKVGKRLLRERRSVGSLVAKSVSDLDDQSSGESEDGGDESDVSVASFSISSEDSRSADSDSSTDSDDSSDSSDRNAKSSDSDKDAEDRSVDSKGSEKKVKKKKKGRSGSTKGRRHLERRRSTRNSSVKRAKRSESAGSGGRDASSKRRAKKDKRKLRPTRNCAKGKLKEISGESEEERGSSGEEWIMRGELGKRKKEKSRIVYGDGSEFRRPGWEEELIDFKKKLRMPSKLIRVAKPSSLSSTPSGKGKEDIDSAALQPVVVISPAKSTKENKSPNKTGSPDVPLGESGIPPPVHVPRKGRPPKNRTPQKEGEVMAEKGKKSPKTPKGKKAGGVDGSPGSGTKGGARPTGTGKRKKGKGVETTVNGDCSSGVSHQGLLREERDKGLELLPTPGGGSGVKFNKKMSIKSVLGVVIPSSEEGLTSLVTTPPVTESISMQSSPAVPVPPKKALRRNKFKSGFDYIRKKKKAGDPNLPPPPKRTKASQEKNMTEDDVQNELRCWVLNKGLGETILHRAARLGYPDVAAYTLEHDICSPNCKDNAGYSPLHETCMKGNLEVAKILLAYGANPSQAAPGGIRPLHEACENGHVELVRLLIAFGADPLLATYAGQTPIELAEHHKPVKRLLEQHIRDVQGREEKLWEFRGTGKWADDRHDSGFDVTEDPPIPPPQNDLDLEGFEFEASELPLPPIYMLKEDIPYILLQDLINYLGLPKDRILKSHPGAELVELNSNDFLEDVHCRALLGVKFRLNLSSDLLVLIKYDDVVKKMLNIESCFIN